MRFVDGIFQFFQATLESLVFLFIGIEALLIFLFIFHLHLVLAIFQD